MFVCVSHVIEAAQLYLLPTLFSLLRYGRITGCRAGCRSTCRRGRKQSATPSVPIPAPPVRIVLASPAPPHSTPSLLPRVVSALVLPQTPSKVSTSVVPSDELVPTRRTACASLWRTLKIECHAWKCASRHGGHVRFCSVASDVGGHINGVRRRVRRKAPTTSAPKLGRDAGVSCHIGGTGRRVSRANTAPVEGQAVLSVSRRRCVGQHVLGWNGDARPSPAVPPFFLPGSPQNLANKNLPPQHLPTGPCEKLRQ